MLPPLTGPGDARRHLDPNVHAGSARRSGARRSRKARTSSNILVGDHIDEHATPFRVDTDRKAFGEGADGPFVAFPMVVQHRSAGLIAARVVRCQMDAAPLECRWNSTLRAAC